MLASMRSELALVSLGALGCAEVVSPPAELFGCSVATLGDLDGDGVDDFAISGGYDIEDSGPGDVWVFSGATRDVLLHVRGDAPGDGFGLSLLGPGDLDADGVPDLVVGASGPIGADSPPTAGYVRAIGGRDGDALYDVALPGDGFLNWWHFRGAGPALAALGDVDGDGRPDYAVGSRFVANGGGRVACLSGADGSELWALGTDAEDAFLGAALVPLEDRDGDGVAELLATAPGADQLVLSGASGAVLLAFGSDQSESLGFDAVATSDVTGDGVAELVLGEPNVMTGHGAEGRVHLHDGATGARLATWDHLPGDRYLGTELTSLPDRDGDGVPEVGVGIEYRPLVVDGASGREALDLSFPRVDPLTIGLAPYEYGRLVARVGDLDGDGLDDVAVASGTLRAGGFESTVTFFSLRTGAALFELSTPAR